MISFKELGVGEELVKAITELGFDTPTPIQEQAIPELLKPGSRDLIGLAQTGTGKTAAFGLPLLQALDFQKKKPQALILSPTRELCMQITGDLQSYSKYLPNVGIVAVYGGASIQTQIAQIKKGVQIVVATPGRVLDLIDRRAVDISQVEYLVLDEADEMLNMGFREDIDSILSNTPEEKKVWLFSATMPSEVRNISKNYMTDPFELTVGKKNTGAENIEHIYYVVHARDKYRALKRLVDFNPDIFGIVFCRTKLESQEVAENLIKDGYNADALHGDLSQQQRDKVMKRFRDKSLQLLIATDVAARGIDVDNVTHVINYDLPDELESYTHRSGRTARAGKSGVSIAIINMKETGKIRHIEKQINKKFVAGKIPDGVEVCEKQLFNLINKVHKVEVNEKEIEKYLPGIFEELKDLDKEELIKRFASIEFNRFLEYYRNAPDINVDLDRRNTSNEESFRKGSTVFLNLGSMDGFDKGSMLKYFCSITDIKGEVVGRIEVKGVYSFIDVEPEVIDQALEAFQGEVYRGRPVRADKSGSQGGGGSRNRGGGGGRKDWGSGGNNSHSRGFHSKEKSGRSYSSDKPSYNKRESGGSGGSGYSKRDSGGGSGYSKRDSGGSNFKKDSPKPSYSKPASSDTGKPKRKRKEW